MNLLKTRRVEAASVVQVYVCYSISKDWWIEQEGKGGLAQHYRQDKPLPSDWNFLRLMIFILFSDILDR